MLLSDFGTKLTSRSGILQLMDDLGKPLPPGPSYKLGGGNPARIPEVEAIYRSEMEKILKTNDSFENAIACYDSPQGRHTFIEAIAKMLSVKYGWQISPENVAITNGSQSAFFYLFNMFSGTFSSQEKTYSSSKISTQKKTILFPLVPEYIGYADQGIESDTFVTLPAKVEYYSDNTFKYFIDFPLLEDYLQKHSEVGALCVSRPTNPTGNVLTDEEIKHLASLAKKYGIYLLVDNAYGTPFPKIIFTEAEPYWDSSTVLSMSLSKIGLPTLRTGIIVANKEIISALSAINSIVALTSGSLGQVLAENLVSTGKLLTIASKYVTPFYQQKAKLAENWIREFFKNRDWMMHKSEGAIFQWIRIKDMKISSLELYERLKKRGVIVVPGEYFFFGEGGLNHEHRTQCLRINYSRPEEEVREGIRIIEEESLY